MKQADVEAQVLAAEGDVPQLEVNSVMLRAQLRRIAELEILRRELIARIAALAPTPMRAR